MPSVECILRRRRLLYAPKLLKHAPPSLQAMLQTIHTPRGPVMPPWSKQLVDDMRILKQYFTIKLIEMPDPLMQPQAWAVLMTEFPQEWRMLVVEYIDFHSPFTERSREEVVPHLSRHRCSVCANAPVFKHAKALASHMRSKHGVRSDMNKYIGDTGVCPVCGTDFHNRVRLLAHVSDMRVRSKTRRVTCG
eukprot:2033769-Karenia_brevis.AAC.1